MEAEVILARVHVGQGGEVIQQTRPIDMVELHLLQILKKLLRLHVHSDIWLRKAKLDISFQCCFHKETVDLHHVLCKG